MDVGKGREQERKLFRRIRMARGNTSDMIFYNDKTYLK